MSDKVTQLDRHATLCRQQAAAARDPAEQRTFLKIAVEYEVEANVLRERSA